MHIYVHGIGMLMKSYWLASSMEHDWHDISSHAAARKHE